MDALIGFWGYALAAVAFAALLIWRVIEPSRRPGQRLLLAAFALTACWAWLSAIDRGGGLMRFAETARNLIWIGLLYSLSNASDERQHGVRLVYGAVAAVLGLQVVATAFMIVSPSAAVEATVSLLRVTAAAGALVLVHNLYGQAAPASRSHIRMVMIGLAAMWIYDLNFYTIRYLGAPGAGRLGDWRGAVMALTALPFALGARQEDGWRIRLSRAASFQSLSLLAICAYFALMTIVTTALRGSDFDWSAGLMVAVLALMTVGAMVLLPSARARSWLKIKLAKHLFEHRYDYRSEWLRFADTLGSSGNDSDSLPERIVRAFADIVDSPGGLLLGRDGAAALSLTADWNWPAASPPAGDLGQSADFLADLEASGRIVEFEGLRRGWAAPSDKAIRVPDWLYEDPCVWAGIPLIHHQRLIGIVILAAPEFRRALDWEDFDLLRTAGRQAASSLAEAQGQEALANAQRFEEFNRRFAFILHDIKNLVSQLSLLARNAERHADNPDFRADMVGTLKASAGKMNDLLARLAPRAQSRVEGTEPQPLRPILAAAIASRRGDRDVQLQEDSQLWAKVDAAALDQALGHLLQNALEASPWVESVVVRVGAAGEDVAVAISDKGPGMDGEFIRNRLFQPFASTKANGFGIGAFEARSLVAAMGGRIVVDSRPGEGTTFTIFLPAAAAQAEFNERKRA